MTDAYAARVNPFPPEGGSYPVCPICGEVCSTVYRRDGEVLVCDQCIDEEDASEEPQCFEDEL